MAWDPYRSLWKTLGHRVGALVRSCDCGFGSADSGLMNRFDPNMPSSTIRTEWPVELVAATLGAFKPSRSAPAAQSDLDQGIRQFWDDIGEGQIVQPSAAVPEPQDVSPSPTEIAVTRTVRSAVLQLERPPFVWGGLGFIAGILAWHVIGFWGFVSEAVYNQDGVVEQVALERPTRTAPAVAGYARVAYKADPKYCVSLIIDRASGLAQPAACPGDIEPLRDAGRQLRGNSLVANNLPVEQNAWSTATAVDAAKPETGTLEGKDFDLEIHTDKLDR